MKEKGFKMSDEDDLVVAFDRGPVSECVRRMFATSTIMIDMEVRESLFTDSEVVEFHRRPGQALSTNERALWVFVLALAGRGDLPLGWRGEPMALLIVEAFAARMGFATLEPMGPVERRGEVVA